MLLYVAVLATAMSILRGRLEFLILRGHVWANLGYSSDHCLGLIMQLQIIMFNYFNT